jgi:hypothetical protein
MACNENGWWYYQDGRLDWNYTGMGLNEYGWWLYQNGNIAWDYTGDVYADNAIYKIVNGHAVDVVDVSQNTSDSNPTVSITEEQAYAAIIAMKEEYPEGMPWGNDKTYISKAKGTEHKGTACHAFALILSDAAFDDLPFEKHTDLTKIRVGDILRINNDTHSVVVLEVKSDSVIVAEGNYNSSVHWGREISMSKIYETNTVVWTRYPD